MTKKHFKAFAEAIARIGSIEDRKKMEDFIGQVCSRENSMFDWARWHNACNGLPYKK